MDKIRKIIREYITQDEVYLWKYFNMTQEEKLNYLPEEYPYELIDFFSENEETIINKIGEEKVLELKQMIDADTTSAMQFIEDDHPDLYRDFAEYILRKVEGSQELSSYGQEELPAWSFFSAPEIVKNQWLIHFTSSDNAYDIYKNGFTKGVEEINKLGLTTQLGEFDKKYGGYNFAYKANNFKRYASGRHGYKYGDTAVLFKASGIQVWHQGDEEPQVIFYGNTATNTNIIEETGGEWVLESEKTRQNLIKSEDLEKVVNWVVKNEDQYRKHLAEDMSTGIYTGEEVAHHVIDITPHEDDIPHHFLEIIKGYKFKVKQIDIRTLLESDPDFKEYFDSYDPNLPRYNDDEVGGMHLDEAVVVVNGELLDGYNRCTLNIHSGNYMQDAYINLPKQNLNEIRKLIREVINTSNQPKLLSPKIFTQSEMIPFGANYHLHHGMLMMIPVDKVDGLDPTPGGYYNDNGDYVDFKPGKDIEKPIEVVYDPEMDLYMLYDGNHRVTQAKMNGDKYIKAFVQADKNTYNKWKS